MAPGAPVAQRFVEGIDSNVDFGDLAAVGKFGADFLPDIEHWRFVALTLADHDVAAHRDRVHGLAHGFGGDLVGQVAVSGAHGAGRSDRGFLDDSQKFEREIGLHVDSEAFDLGFGTRVSSHEKSLR
jgi:hypothetical protein